MNAVMDKLTKVHCHLELDDLIRKSDDALATMLQGGTPVEMRTHLVLLRASGKKFLVVSECDHKKPDGSCAGHRLTDADIGDIDVA